MDGLPDEEKRKHIRNFLADFKELMGEGGLFITNRVENRQALINLGLTERLR